MKKHNGISLIETLISLVIVGVSLVALMPVVTVKNNSASMNNDYWTNSFAGIQFAPYATRNTCLNINNNNQRMCPVRIGDASQPVADGSFFVVDNSGFENSNMPAINVLNKLHFNGQDIFADTLLPGVPNPQSLFISTQVDNFSYVDPVTNNNINTQGALSNIYQDANNVIIQNDNHLDIDSTFNGYTEAPMVPVHTSRSNHVYKVSNHNNNVNNEYLYVDAQVVAGGNARNNVGVGQNAAKYRDNGNFVGILNSGTLNNPPHDPTTHRVVAIGALQPNNQNAVAYSDPTKYALHYNEAWADAAGNNKPEAYDISAGTLATPVGVGFRVNKIIFASDKRLKNIVGKFEKGLNEILKINPVLYTFKSDEKKIPHVGVIAQDLKKIFPKSVVKNPQTGYLMISQDEMFYALLNSIKELNAKNKSIEEENIKLEKKIAKLREIRDNLKTSKGGNL